MEQEKTKTDYYCAENINVYAKVGSVVKSFRFRLGTLKSLRQDGLSNHRNHFSYSPSLTARSPHHQEEKQTETLEEYSLKKWNEGDSLQPEAPESDLMGE